MIGNPARPRTYQFDIDTLAVQYAAPRLRGIALATAHAMPSASPSRKIPTAPAAKVDLPPAEDSAGESPDAAAVRWTAGVCRGDGKCLESVYRAWFDRAYSQARATTRRDESFCLDAVQDAMVRVAQSMRPLASRAALDAWMTATVRSACIDALRREKRRLVRERTTGRPGGGTGNGAGARAEEGEALAWTIDQLDKLDAESAALLRARYAEGRTLAQTGQETGQTGAAAHGKVRRLLAKLAETARDAFGGLEWRQP